MEWISVKDRLPEHCEGVLVCGKGALSGSHNIYVMQFAELFCGDNKWHFTSNFNESEVTAPYSDCGDVLHIDNIEYWSELPPQPNQPERSKREDSQECEMRCSEHCGNTVRDK